MRTFRLIRTVLYAVLLCVNFASCSSGGDDIIDLNPTPEIIKEEIKIDSNIISNGLSFTNEKGEQSISFSTNVNWTLSIAETRSGIEWCTASSTSGIKGNSIVRFAVSENTDYDDRSVSVTIKSGLATKTFKIIQKCKKALLVTTNKYEVSQEGGTIDIEVKSNVDYKMEISEAAKNWILESSSRGLTPYKHSLNIAVNEKSEKREGEIYFKSDNQVDTVKVYQSGGAVLILSKKEFNVSDKGETISVDVKSNVEFGIQMPDVDWITDESSCRGLSSHTMKYIVKSNNTYDDRSAEIIFYDKNSDLKDTLKVIQAQEDAIIIGKKEYEVKAEGETIEINLESNVDFEIFIEDNWIKQVESKSTRALVLHKLYLQIVENESEEERNSHIYITDKDKIIAETITITQKGNDKNIPYLTFTSNSKQSLTMSKAVETLEFSINGSKEWEKLGTNTIDFGGELGSLRLRGRNSNGTGNDFNNHSTIYFGNENPVACSGDIRTLLDYANIETVNTSNASFYYLFENCSNLIQAPELPATILAKGCYAGMFYNCSNLTQAPELPATTLASNCYSYMFNGCTSLTQAPELPAMTLASNCYSYMFNGCTSLTQAPELPATTLASDCYSAMFLNCSNLIHAPKLPATILAKGCYAGMFYNCSNLTHAPELPAKTLANSCYDSMFVWCESLTEAPELLATTLVTACYSNMFRDCSKLHSITMLATNTSATNCLYDWVSGVASTGTFTKAKEMTSLQEGNNGIPLGWIVQDKE